MEPSGAYYQRISQRSGATVSVCSWLPLASDLCHQRGGERSGGPTHRRKVPRAGFSILLVLPGIIPLSRSARE